MFKSCGKGSIFRMKYSQATKGRNQRKRIVTNSFTLSRTSAQ